MYLCCTVQVFDDKNQFAEWFGDSFGKTAPGAGGEDDVAMEKRVVVIHRLHQILEPFMLRRQVQDVEGKLPPKVTVVHMAASHGCITWLHHMAASHACITWLHHVAASHGCITWLHHMA